MNRTFSQSAGDVRTHRLLQTARATIAIAVFVTLGAAAVATGFFLQCRDQLSAYAGILQQRDETIATRERQLAETKKSLDENVEALVGWQRAHATCKSDFKELEAVTKRCLDLAETRKGGCR